MSSRKHLAAIFLGLLLFGMQLGFGQATQPAPERFQHERAIIPGGSGPNRLLIDATLLAGGSSSWQFARRGTGSEREPMTIAAGGLKDLRIYDSLNREVPYLLILPPEPEPKWLDGRVAPDAPAKKTSGFQIDFERPLLMDRLRLTGLPAPFVKRCILEAGNDASRWTMLRNDTTIFDLPSEKLRLLDIEFDPGEYRYLRVIWDDSASARIPLPRAAEARLVSAGSLPARLQENLQFERRASEPGTSRYRLRLPGSHLPITEIKLSANGGYVLRQARITEGRLSDGEIVPKVLGTATLRREVRGDLSAASMSIPIASPQEAQIDLVIEDGNNPPLDITEVSAFFVYLPWIYFESADTKPLTARYGYPNLEEPRYDLEAARTSAVKAHTAEARWETEAQRRPVVESSTSNEMPGLGPAIDSGGFRYARRIPAEKPGLSALALDAAVLAHSRIADLRIAGPNGRQVPYLVEKAEEPLFMDLPALEKVQAPDSLASGGRNGADTRSYYKLKLPFENLPAARLVITTSARVFRRNISILIEKNPFNERQKPWTESIAEATWGHADPEIAAPALTLKIPSLKTTEAMVVVEEGDNSPLPITSITLLLPTQRLRFFNQADLSLYYGQKDMEAPRYDLAILAPRLIGEPAEEIQLGPEVEALPLKPKSLSVRLFWGILIVAVVSLLGLIARLIKKA
jgi:hypothetical protein